MCNGDIMPLSLICMFLKERSFSRNMVYVFSTFISWFNVCWFLVAFQYHVCFKSHCLVIILSAISAIIKFNTYTYFFFFLVDYSGRKSVSLFILVLMGFVVLVVVRVYWEELFEKFTWFSLFRMLDIFFIELSGFY